MTGRRSALALALCLTVVACIPPTQLPPSPDGSSPSPTTPAAAGASHRPASPVPSPATIFAIQTGQRPSGPWVVTFQSAGSPAVREVFVLAPACAQASCDIDATIQTFDGEPIGAGVFRYAEGMYRYEADRRDTVACDDGLGVVADGAISTSHTTLLLAGYRPDGTAVITVDIRGTRTVDLAPTGGSTCAVESLDYVANAEKTEFAAAPTPTPKPPAAPKVPVIGDTFFGSNAKVVTYGVSGASILQIVDSIEANGPWSAWIHARAEGLTKAVPSYHFDLVQDGSQCRIAVTAKPAVLFSYTITLPKWARPKTADGATVRWWAAEILRVATHERHHVEIYRDGAVRMTDAVAHATCATLPGKLAAIVKDVDTQQCQFDLAEYGSALGLSLASCLKQ